MKKKISQRKVRSRVTKQNTERDLKALATENRLKEQEAQDEEEKFALGIVKTLNFDNLLFLLFYLSVLLLLNGFSKVELGSIMVGCIVSYTVLYVPIWNNIDASRKELEAKEEFADLKDLDESDSDEDEDEDMSGDEKEKLKEKDKLQVGKVLITKWSFDFFCTIMI